MKKVVDATTDPGHGDGWFKVQEDGFGEGAWGVDRLVRSLLLKHFATFDSHKTNVNLMIDRERRGSDHSDPVLYSAWAVSATCRNYCAAQRKCVTRCSIFCTYLLFPTFLSTYSSCYRLHAHRSMSLREVELRFLPQSGYQVHIMYEVCSYVPRYSLIDSCRLPTQAFLSTSTILLSPIILFQVWLRYLLHLLSLNRTRAKYAHLLELKGICWHFPFRAKTDSDTYRKD